MDRQGIQTIPAQSWLLTSHSSTQPFLIVIMVTLTQLSCSAPPLWETDPRGSPPPFSFISCRLLGGLLCTVNFGLILRDP